jgi:hypothetical protein
MEWVAGHALRRAGPGPQASVFPLARTCPTQVKFKDSGPKAALQRAVAGCALRKKERDYSGGQYYWLFVR